MPTEFRQSWHMTKPQDGPPHREQVGAGTDAVERARPPHLLPQVRTSLVLGTNAVPHTTHALLGIAGDDGSVSW